ncbi:hypothetical protein XNC1_p0166 (plasmid) [Xenorhabdus nematophila ATCC 19061]|uniref:Uncharacterized protein n=1 Tax=Xenorhabdus nematophila (strain ATCC 19061 / DSM 3370 / CCUG 14189 / LMG 1036 / NCIMB 9965 / AN6) TaxID=406817 RepID=D3VM82_XENNA|nr:hypothetical protein XNC1_p0166 [Xenorhabdus nematophila ATCC 19061]
MAPLPIDPFWSGKTLLFLWRKVSHVKVFFVKNRLPELGS